MTDATGLLLTGDFVSFMTGNTTRAALALAQGDLRHAAVLFTVFINDTRVDPLHGYKMCAALQHATASDRPVLLRAEGQVGHGQRAVSFTAGLAGDSLAFVARETGLPVSRSVMSSAA